MEERIAAYRLRFGKVPEWAKEYLERKSLANKRERGAKGLVSLGKGKKGGGLKLKTKNLESDSSSSDPEEPLPKQRARTDQFFSVPAKFGKSKRPVFNWDKVADEEGSDSDYESKDNVAPLQPKKNPYVGFGVKNKSQTSGTQSVTVQKQKFDFSGFEERASESSGDEDYNYAIPVGSKGKGTQQSTSFMGKGNLTDQQKQVAQGGGKFFGTGAKIDGPGLGLRSTSPKKEEVYDFSNGDGFGSTYVDPAFRRVISSIESPAKQQGKPPGVYSGNSNFDFEKVKRKNQDDVFGEFDGANADHKKVFKQAINKSKK